MRRKTAEAVRDLSEFIGRNQMRVLAGLCRGEEGEWFREKLRELAEQVRSMPMTYETDGEGDAAVAHLHYFTPSMDFYITERDAEPEQHQAFGLVAGYETELGYISLREILACGAELDLHWIPKPVGEIRGASASAW